ncbi:hypothetical protein DB346_07960 [Verrucomicrobia bacterium LW23]|nr:hypothetical protein DB346_07960 [Verrucomicrobia bacterium LW23]
MPQPKRLSQQAIAAATGVSRATVSLILRGATGSSEKTRARVMAAAEKMGYRPNALVRSIRSGKSRTMGVLVPPHDSFWQEVCYGIHDRLTEADHLPLFLWDTERHTEPRETYALAQIHRLLDRWVDAVILWPEFANYYARHLHEFERRNIPVVLIDHAVPGFAVDTVGHDEALIAGALVRHLAALGHRYLLVVAGPEQLGWADDRCAAIAQELAMANGISAAGHNGNGKCASPGAERARHHIAADFLRVPLSGDPSHLVAERLAATPSVTAVIGATDHLAEHAYTAAARLGLSVPGRLSIAGVGNLLEAKYFTPPLTTVRQDGYAVGQKAAQAALERTAGILVGPPRRFSLPAELIVRASTAEASRRDV